VAIILTIFLRINYPNFIGLVWCRHTKFQIGIALYETLLYGMPDIPLLAPLTRVKSVKATRVTY